MPIYMPDDKKSNKSGVKKKKPTKEKEKGLFGRKYPKETKEQPVEIIKNNADDDEISLDDMEDISDAELEDINEYNQFQDEDFNYGYNETSYEEDSEEDFPDIEAPEIDDFEDENLNRVGSLSEDETTDADNEINHSANNLSQNAGANKPSDFSSAASEPPSEASSESPRRREKYRKVKQKESKHIVGKQNKKAIIAKKVVGIVIAAGLIVIAYYGFKDAYQSEFVDKTTVSKEQRVVPDIVGYEMESALKKLSVSDVRYDVKYIDDDLYLYDTVIKTEPGKNARIDEDDFITVYVKQKPKNIAEGIVETEKTPFERDYIDVMSFSADNGYFSIIIKNNNDVTIKSLEYTLQYQNKEGERYGLRTYCVTDINVKKGETYTLYGPIKQSGDTYLSIYSFKGNV